jgi:hypothetical protein
MTFLASFFLMIPLKLITLLRDILENKTCVKQIEVHNCTATLKYAIEASELEEINTERQE